jgi:hypothetical protein
MKVLNLWGGPGSGKSTTAAGLFYQMKKMGLEVELVQEYAKDAVWENRSNVLDDQIYIFAKQQRRISRLTDHGIEWAVTDSPISLGLVYLRDGVLSSHFNELVMEEFNKFENHNFLLKRNFAYNPVGRTQTPEQAEEVDQRIINLLNRYSVPYRTVTCGEHAVSEILENLW